MPLSLYLSVYFKSTDRYNDNKEGGNLGTVWAYRMRQAQTVPKFPPSGPSDARFAMSKGAGAQYGRAYTGRLCFGLNRGEAKRSRAEG